MSPIKGHGTAVLPADYAREHVRLGYVALTRGQRENTVLVVTETHDIAEARDVLERILTNDSFVLPATAQRRQLAETDHTPQRTPPQPRCSIPDWLPDLEATIHTELPAAEQAAVRHDEQRTDLETRLMQAKQQLTIAERGLDPYRPALAAAHADIDEAQNRIWAANNLALRSKGRYKRAGARASDRPARTLGVRVVEL